MNKTNITLFILSFFIVFGMSALGSYTAPVGSAPANGNTTNPSNNTINPMETSATNNEKAAGLGVGPFVSGTTDLIVINTSGNIGIHQSNAPSDVRVEVDGDISGSSLSGTGTGFLCTSTNGSSSNGYTLIRC